MADSFDSINLAEWQAWDDNNSWYHSEGPAAYGRVAPYGEPALDLIRVHIHRRFSTPESGLHQPDTLLSLVRAVMATSGFCVRGCMSSDEFDDIVKPWIHAFIKGHPSGRRSYV